MALEGEVLALKGVIYMVYRHTPFNRADQIAGGVWKACYASGLKLERRLKLLDDSSRVAKVENLDAPVGKAHYKQRCTDVHAIHSVWQVLCMERVRLAKIPVLEGLVPGASDKHVVEEVHVSDWGIMLCYGLLAVAGKVPDFGLLVAAC